MKTCTIAGKQDAAYRRYLDLAGRAVQRRDRRAVFATDLANALFPPQRVLDEVLDRINSDELQDIWAEDEAIGWIYQYFTPKELRDKARKNRKRRATATNSRSATSSSRRATWSNS